MASVYDSWFASRTWVWNVVKTTPWGEADGKPNPWVIRDRLLTHCPGISLINLFLRVPGSYGDLINLLILLTALMMAVAGGLYGAYTHEEILRYDADHSPGGMYWCAETFNTTHYYCADFTKDEADCSAE